MEKEDDEGNKYTEEEQVRVNTHHADGEFEYEDWKDMSDKVGILFFIEKLTAVRLHVYDNIRYSPKAQRMYEDQKDEFISDNHRDQEYDFSESEFVPGYKPNIACYSDGMPCYLNKYVLIFADIIGLGWTQRLSMLFNTGETYFNIRKVIQR